MNAFHKLYSKNAFKFLQLIVKIYSLQSNIL